MHDEDHLGEAAVRRILERTAALDATLGRTLTVAQLRAVVRDAGFSDASLRVALAELAAEHPLVSAEPEPWWRRAIHGSWRVTAVVGTAAAAIIALSSVGAAIRPYVGPTLADAVTVAGIVLGLGAGFQVARRVRSRLGQLLSAGLALAVLVDTLFDWSGFLVNGRSAKVAEVATAVAGVAVGMWLSRRERSAPPPAPLATTREQASASHAEEKRQSSVWFDWRWRGFSVPTL